MHHCVFEMINLNTQLLYRIIYRIEQSSISLGKLPVNAQTIISITKTVASGPPLTATRPRLI
jgi:hypothetical protein